MRAGRASLSAQRSRRIFDLQDQITSEVGAVESRLQKVDHHPAVLTDRPQQRLSFVTWLR
jgi:hypothetical protein